MATLNTSPGSTAFDVTMEDRASAQPAYGRRPIGPAARRAAVHEEMKRMTKLPATSTYTSHLLRVLNKILPTFVHSENCITGCGVGTAFFWAVSVSPPFRLCAEYQNHGFLHGWTKVVSHVVRNVDKACNVCNAKM